MHNKNERRAENKQKTRIRKSNVQIKFLFQYFQAPFMFIISFILFIYTKLKKDINITFWGIKSLVWFECLPRLVKNIR